MTARRLGVLALVFTLLSLGTPEEPRWTGMVSAKGHEPFVVLALVDDQGRQWTLLGPLVKQMWSQVQGRRLTVTGQIEGSDAILVRSWAWADGEERR